MPFRYLALLLFFSASAAANYLDAIKPVAVAPGVYAIITPARDIPNPENMGWNSNSAFVVTSDGVLVFDTGSSQAIGEAIKAAIQKVTDKPVKWIINSHAHGDHWLGNVAFKDSQPQIIASATAQKLIAEEGHTWVVRFNRLTNGTTGNTPVIQPHTIINEHTTLQTGETQVVIFPSANSHSPGDLIAWLPQQRVLICGDVVYSDRMPSTNVSSLYQWIATLENLEKLQPVAIIPGHGNLTDKQGLRRLHDLLSGILQEVTRGYEAGLSDFEMLPQVISALKQYEPYFPGFREKLGRDISKVYLQVEAASFK